MARIQQDFQTIQQRMGELSQRTGRIKGVMAKAVTTDLAAGALGGVVGFGAVVAQVRERVGAIERQVAALEATKNELTKNLGGDVDKLGVIVKQYADAERRAREGVRKPGQGGHPGKPAGPKKPAGGHGGTHGAEPTGPKKPMPTSPKKPTGGHGGHGGHGEDPAPTVSHEGAIKVSQVGYQGAGKYRSGEAACREYISQALDAMGVTDPKARAAWTEGMLTIASRESSYNAPGSQINAWDSNAHGAIVGDGKPANCSRGGWQCIPSTFAANHVKGTSTDIYDPVANVAASMTYIRSRYKVAPDGHDLASKVPQANPHHKPQGY
ncbi:transglycosylase SLT domain-containing protein [Kitasatospora sp. SolWspMP-SS2h]|uniref:transglycosylase SLT domain-containing protein n=1 Tax=Kitasatospora sp. SolWspMP-SS2h TaxID=1305729 RepID=UPI0013145B3D|nr:transglycosylase SLT domain-containing protein [Kitasatospora sp. SolWspMP-SS2h]